MRGKVFLAVTVLTVAAVLISILFDKAKPVTEVPSAEISLVPSGVVTNTVSPTEIPTTASQARALGRNPAASSGPADPKFQQWITQEAKSLDHPNVDGERKEAEIKEVVKRLTPQQSRQLLQTASSVHAPAGEKILATYLMVQGGLNSRAELAQFISGPLNEKGPHVPHTEGEIKGVREKSLRIMAIDGLVSQVKTDPAARQALARAIAESEDPYIKGYAQEKLNELDRQ